MAQTRRRICNVTIEERSDAGIWIHIVPSIGEAEDPLNCPRWNLQEDGNVTKWQPFVSIEDGDISCPDIAKCYCREPGTFHYENCSLVVPSPCHLGKHLKTYLQFQCAGQTSVDNVSNDDTNISKGDPPFWVIALVSSFLLILISSLAVYKLVKRVKRDEGKSEDTGEISEEDFNNLAAPIRETQINPIYNTGAISNQPNAYVMASEPASLGVDTFQNGCYEEISAKPVDPAADDTGQTSQDHTYCVIVANTNSARNDTNDLETNLAGGERNGEHTIVDNVIYITRN